MTTQWMRRGFASDQVKLLLAGALAVAGVLLAIRGVLPTRSERTDRAKPEIVTADGSVPTTPRGDRPPPDPADFGWVEDQSGAAYEFRRVSNAAEARNLADAIGRAIDTSDQASDGLGGDLVSLLTPALAGEGSAEVAVTELGGTSHGSIRVVDAIMQTMLKHASADPSAVSISTPDEQPRALGNMSINRNRTTEADAEGNEVERDVISLMTSFEGAFPEALAEGATGRLRTVEIPMRSSRADGSDADMRLELTLRFNAAAKAWQPAAMTIDSTDPGAMRSVMDAVRAIQRASSDTESEGDD
ncbi:MAG: hypothetical protein AAF937_11815 [Planctomycetota bacterium]